MHAPAEYDGSMACHGDLRLLSDELMQPQGLSSPMRRLAIRARYNRRHAAARCILAEIREKRSRGSQ